MKIDNDCVRSILFVIEEESSIDKSCNMLGAFRKYPALEKYSEDGIIRYHLRYLEMKGMIFKPNPEYEYCYDLTPSGHEFLANIREDNNWKKIKSISSNIGFASLKVISAIAEGVATAAINKQLGLSE